MRPQPVGAPIDDRKRRGEGFHTRYASVAVAGRSLFAAKKPPVKRAWVTVGHRSNEPEFPQQERSHTYRTTTTPRRAVTNTGA
jgi:hypothetical protein